MKYLLLLILLFSACTASVNCDNLTAFECTTLKAAKTNNVELCDDTVSPNLCKSFFAVGTNNKEVCDALPEAEKMNCVLGISYNKFDFSYCYAHDYAARAFAQEINTTSRIDTCNAIILTQHPLKEMCDEYPTNIEGVEAEEWNNYCNFWVGRQLQNVEMCQTITDQHTQTSCLLSINYCDDGDVCMLTFAKQQKSIEYCNGIKDTLVKDICFYEVSLISNNWDGCDGSNQKKLSCYMQLLGR